MNLAVLGERNLERFGEYEAVVFDDVAVTNAEQLRASHRMANALTALGIGRDDRVAVMMPNCLEVFQAYGAISQVGAVVVPIVFLLAVPEIRHILADCTPRAVVTSPEFAGTVLMAIEGLPDRPVVLVTGALELPGTTSLAALTDGASSEFAFVERDDDDLAVIMYTGGTTGRPKGVMLSHGNLLWVAQKLAEDADVKPDDVGLTALPASHLFGMIVGLLGQALGTKGVLLRWFAPESVLEAVQRYRVTAIPMVPAMATMLLQHPDLERYDTSSLRTIILSAAPVPLELKEAVARTFGCDVVEAYGQTEASPAIAIERPEDQKRPGSCGKPIDGIDVAILDSGGVPVPAGETGEICARSPGIMKGYFGMPEATEETLAGGWLHTGDMGHLDADGYLFVTDRKKDLIIRGGFNIYPRDVEEVLYQHPGIVEAAVVGRPDPVMGEEEVVAFVVIHPGAEMTETELLAFCLERLAKYKTPREVRFVGSLPKSPIGKILKKDLRATLASSGQAVATRSEPVAMPCGLHRAPYPAGPAKRP